MSDAQLKPREVMVYGSSDDLVEVDGAIYEEFNVYDVPCYLVFGGVLRVKVVYGDDGDWNVECEPVASGVKVPDVLIGQHESGYSQTATFTIPDDLPLTMVREFVEKE